jgi:hypothetical protein
MGGCQIVASLRTTYTYVTLDVSQAAFDEIRAKLEAADYGHAFERDKNENVVTIDMHGLALTVEQTQPKAPLRAGDTIKKATA